MTISEFEDATVDLTRVRRAGVSDLRFTPRATHHTQAPLAAVVDLAATAAPTTDPGHRGRSRARLLRLGVLDFVGVLVAITLAGVPWAIFDNQGKQLSMLTPLRTELPYAPFFVLAFVAYGLYRRELRRIRHDWFVDSSKLFHAAAAGALVTMVGSAAMSRSAGWRPVHPFEAALVACAVFVVVGSSRSLRAALQARRGVVRARVAIIGSGPVARRVAASLGAFDDIRMVGFVDDATADVASLGSPLLGGISDLVDVCKTNGIDRFVVAVSDSRTASVVDALRKLPEGVQVSVVPRLFELITPRSTIEEVHGINLVDIAPPSLGYVQLFLKRAIDIVGSLSLLILLAPAMLTCAIAIRVTSPGPALFRQRRAGRHGTPFTLLKFRSMRCDAEAGIVDLRHRSEVDGPLFKLREDPRVTAVGRFLRATSLDELPQLFNVLFGQMSLVGPRPFVMAEAQEIDGWAARRFAVRPGMTGLWQVSGRSDLPFEDLRHLDYAYVASWSLWWDLRILVKTPATVLARRGAY